MDTYKLIKGSEGLIKKIASQFYGTSYEDLYQAGVLGLLKAYKNYLDNGTCKFSTYAYEYIYGEMYLLVNNKNIKINKDLIRLAKMIDKAKITLTQKYNRVPNTKELSEFLEIKENIINEAIMASKSVASLDNDENYSLYETVKCNEKVNIDDQIFLEQCLDKLSSDEKKIIKARYYDDLTQSQVAKNLMMTQVMVSRYEKKGLEKMHAFMMQ